MYSQATCIYLPTPIRREKEMSNDPTVQNEPVLQVMSRCNQIQVIVDNLQQAMRAAVDKADIYIKISVQARLEMEKILKTLEALEVDSDEMKAKLNQPMVRQGNQMISLLQCLRNELKEIVPFTNFGH